MRRHMRVMRAELQMVGVCVCGLSILYRVRPQPKHPPGRRVPKTSSFDGLAAFPCAMPQPCAIVLASWNDNGAVFADLPVSSFRCEHARAEGV